MLKNKKCKLFLHIGIHEEEMWWFLETHKFGTVPHSGYRLGFERLMLFVTGMGNIRDVIPLSRTPNNADYEEKSC